jgi:hypothetical protein
MHSDPFVIIGRLNKKIDKLKKQRDFHQQRHQYYAKVISLQPYIEKRWQTYEDRMKEIERVKQLDKRVKEQEMLIRILAGDKIANYEIDRLYVDMIKQEQKARTEKKI